MIFVPVYGKHGAERVLRAYTLVDEECVELARAVRWRLSGAYVVGTVAGIATSLHRLLTDAAPGLEVHHRNRNPLDNRLCNLEVLTPDEHRLRHGGRLWIGGRLQEAAD